VPFADRWLDIDHDLLTCKRSSKTTAPVMGL
jgi:hypothetical protein